MLGAEIDRLRSLSGVKWTIDGPEVIPAWVADMDFSPAPVVLEAIQAVVDRGDFGYNFATKNQLAETWIKWQTDSFGGAPDAEGCRIVTATLNALAIVLDLHTEPGDGVVMFTPIYHPFRDITEESGRRIVDVPLDGPDWRLDPERFEAALDDTTKLVLFANPHNPLGRMFDHEELAGLVDVAVRNNLLIISDEIWCDLTHQSGHLPLWHHFPEIREQCVTLAAASKSFSLAGLKTALVHIGDPGLLARWDAFPPHYVAGPSVIGAEATFAAWTHGRPWLDEVKAVLTSNRDHLAARVQSDLPGVTMHKPEATYLAWLDMSGTPIADDPAKPLREIGKVGIHGGAKFSPTAAANARVNFATSPAILDEIIDRIATTLASF